MAEEDDDDDSGLNIGVGRYPCMPSLVALQQMRHRLHLAHLGKKLMKWSAIAIGKELRRIALDLKAIHEDYDEQQINAYIALARCRYYNPDLNKIVLEHIQTQATVTISTTTKTVSCVKQLEFGVNQSQVQPYHHLGLGQGGQMIRETKKMWYNLLIRLIQILELRKGFEVVDQAHKTANRKKNVLQKLIIPKLTATLKYILSELEEQEREETFRLKRFKQCKLKNIKPTICACCYKYYKVDKALPCAPKTICPKCDLAMRGNAPADIVFTTCEDVGMELLAYLDKHMGDIKALAEQYNATSCCHDMQVKPQKPIETQEPIAPLINTPGEETPSKPIPDKQIPDQKTPDNGITNLQDILQTVAPPIPVERKKSIRNKFLSFKETAPPKDLIGPSLCTLHEQVKPCELCDLVTKITEISAKMCPSVCTIHNQNKPCKTCDAKIKLSPVASQGMMEIIRISQESLGNKTSLTKTGSNYSSNHSKVHSSKCSVHDQVKPCPLCGMKTIVAPRESCVQDCTSKCSVHNQMKLCSLRDEKAVVQPQEPSAKVTTSKCSVHKQIKPCSLCDVKAIIKQQEPSAKVCTSICSIDKDQKTCSLCKLESLEMKSEVLIREQPLSKPSNGSRDNPEMQISLCPKSGSIFSSRSLDKKASSKTITHGSQKLAGVKEKFKKIVTETRTLKQDGTIIEEKIVTIKTYKRGRAQSLMSGSVLESHSETSSNHDRDVCCLCNKYDSDANSKNNSFFDNKLPKEKRPENKPDTQKKGLKYYSKSTQHDSEAARGYDKGDINTSTAPLHPCADKSDSKYETNSFTSNDLKSNIREKPIITRTTCDKMVSCHNIIKTNRNCDCPPVGKDDPLLLLHNQNQNRDLKMPVLCICSKSLVELLVSETNVNNLYNNLGNKRAGVGKMPLNDSDYSCRFQRFNKEKESGSKLCQRDVSTWDCGCSRSMQLEDWVRILTRVYIHERMSDKNVVFPRMYDPIPRSCVSDCTVTRAQSERADTNSLQNIDFKSETIKRAVKEMLKNNSHDDSPPKTNIDIACFSECDHPCQSCQSNIGVEKEMQTSDKYLDERIPTAPLLTYPISDIENFVIVINPQVSRFPKTHLSTFGTQDSKCNATCIDERISNLNTRRNSRMISNTSTILVYEVETSMVDAYSNPRPTTQDASTSTTDVQDLAIDIYEPWLKLRNNPQFSYRYEQHYGVTRSERVRSNRDIKKGTELSIKGPNLGPTNVEREQNSGFINNYSEKVGNNDLPENHPNLHIINTENTTIPTNENYSLESIEKNVGFTESTTMSVTKDISSSLKSKSNNEFPQKYLNPSSSKVKNLSSPKNQSCALGSKENNRIPTAHPNLVSTKTESASGSKYTNYSSKNRKNNELLAKNQDFTKVKSAPTLRNKINHLGNESNLNFSKSKSADGMKDSDTICIYCLLELSDISTIKVTTPKKINSRCKMCQLKKEKLKKEVFSNNMQKHSGSTTASHNSTGRENVSPKDSCLSAMSSCARTSTHICIDLDTSSPMKSSGCPFQLNIENSDTNGSSTDHITHVFNVICSNFGIGNNTEKITELVKKIQKDFETDSLPLPETFKENYTCRRIYSNITNSDQHTNKGLVINTCTETCLISKPPSVHTFTEGALRVISSIFRAISFTTNRFIPTSEVTNESSYKNIQTDQCLVKCSNCKNLSYKSNTSENAEQIEDESSDHGIISVRPNLTYTFNKNKKTQSSQSLDVKREPKDKFKWQNDNVCLPGLYRLVRSNDPDLKKYSYPFNRRETEPLNDDRNPKSSHSKVDRDPPIPSCKVKHDMVTQTDSTQSSKIRFPVPKTMTKLLNSKNSSKNSIKPLITVDASTETGHQKIAVANTNLSDSDRIFDDPVFVISLSTIEDKDEPFSGKFCVEELSESHLCQDCKQNKQYEDASTCTKRTNRYDVRIISDFPKLRDNSTITNTR